MQDECDSKALIKEKKTSTARRRIVSSTKWRVIEADPKERVAHDGVCHGVCDETRDSVTELIMTGRGRWYRVSALIWCQVQGWWTPSSSSQSECQHTVCLKSLNSLPLTLFVWQVLLRLKTGDCCCWLNTTSSVGRVCVSVFQWSVDYNVTPGTQRHASPLSHACRHHSTLNGRILYLFSQPLWGALSLSVCLILTQHHLTLFTTWPVSSYFPCLPKLKLSEAWGLWGGGS